ncbi:MAG TPA: phosphoribosylglycinamide formyltransferase [Flavobacteriaceae bacterium]|nr:phosphoribosylglycinamide formyltransferase [Flavobacteriaceae bacterium]
MKRIVIFASGSGTNAENLIKFFYHRDNVSVVHVLTNNPRAKVLQRCANLGVKTTVFNKTDFIETQKVLAFLKSLNLDLIVLAGFLWKIPENILKEFPNKIINIHPSLLPKYGGKGMYGKYVHEAVLKNKELRTGITVHYVNENYDDGAIIFQTHCFIDTLDDADDIARKIHVLEMEHFPKVVESVLFQNE